MVIPEEHELLSFFEVEPTLLDKNSPYYYNQITYDVHSEGEHVKVELSPSYDELIITWKQRDITRFHWKFENIEQFSIEKSSKGEYIKLHFHSEEIADTYLWIKPNFKVVGGMVYIP